MLNYNSGLKYNSRVNYNSASYFIIQISDSGGGNDSISPLSLSFTINDSGLTSESISLQNILSLLTESWIATDVIQYIEHELKYNHGFRYNSRINYNVKAKILDFSETYTASEEIGNKNELSLLTDSANGNDNITLLVTPSAIEDIANGNEVLMLKADSYLIEVFTGIESINEKKYDSNEYFVVTTDLMLNPLGVRVLRDNREELIPATRDNTEEIPGMHGEYDFGSEFKARALELKVLTSNGLTPTEKIQFKRKFAQYLNPLKGTKKLVFLDDPDVLYNVKYSGKIEPTNYSNFFEFTIPFKMNNPFIEGVEEKSLVGSGILINDGSMEIGLIIEIAGPVTNPSLNIGGDILTYTGSLLAGDTLTIDTGKQTARIGNTNAMTAYNKLFPLLYPGETTVISADNVTIKWRNKWI